MQITLVVLKHRIFLL